MSRYDASQLTFQRRFSHGMTVNSNYTYASILDDGSVTGESQGGFHRSEFESARGPVQSEGAFLSFVNGEAASAPCAGRMV